MLIKYWLGHPYICSFWKFILWVTAPCILGCLAHEAVEHAHSQIYVGNLPHDPVHIDLEVSLSILSGAYS